MTLSYTVQSAPTGPVTPPNLAGYRLQMSVTTTGGLDPNVFVFQAALANTAASGPADTFYTVASAGQLAALPATNPTAGNPFYRLAALDLVFESEEALQGAQESIAFLLRGLLNAAKALAASGAPVTVTLS